MLGAGLSCKLLNLSDESIEVHFTILFIFYIYLEIAIIKGFF